MHFFHHFHIFLLPFQHHISMMSIVVLSKYGYMKYWDFSLWNWNLLDLWFIIEWKRKIFEEINIIHLWEERNKKMFCVGFTVKWNLYEVLICLISCSLLVSCVVAVQDNFLSPFISSRVLWVDTKICNYISISHSSSTFLVITMRPLGIDSVR